MTVRDEVRVPVAAGLKVTLIVQFAPDAMADPQLLAWAKSPALPPEMTMLLTVKAAVPEFLSVIVFEALMVPTVWLGYVSPAGESVADGPFAVAVPDKVTAWGLLEGSTVMSNVVVRVPGAEGLKVTLIEQFSPAAREPAQFVVSEKSPALAPVILMAEIFTAEVLELVTVTVLGPPVVPTAKLPKLMLVAERLITGRVATEPALLLRHETANKQETRTTIEKEVLQI